MKRIATISLAALLAVAIAIPAMAAEVSIGGAYKVGFIYRNHFKFRAENTPEDRFWAHQNSNVNFTFAVDEDTKVYFEIGMPNSRWGGDLGYSGDNTGDRRLRLSYSYVDWKFKQIGLNARVGLQQIRTPGFAAGTPVMHDKVVGINLSKSLGDVASINAAWLRLADAGNVEDEFDMFYVALPIRLEGLTLLPWGEYSLVGKNVSGRSTFAGATGGEDWDMWHAGISADMKFGDFFVKADFMYGAAEADKGDAEVKGYYAAAKAGMKLGFGTPALTAWYASGNDDKDIGKNQYGLLPTLISDGDPAFTPTGMASWGCAPLTTGFFITSTGVGTAGVALALENMSFVDKLFHTPRVAYWMGTSDEGAAGNILAVRAGGDLAIDKKDSVIEFNFDSRYAFSKNLNIFFDIGYLIADWDKKGPNQSNVKWNEDAMRIATSFIWTF